MTLRKIVIVTCLLSLPAFYAAQTPKHATANPVSNAQRHIFKSWGTDDGLPQTTVTAILQTRDGYLWIGTYGGLVRYDGVKFTLFHSRNTPELKSIRIRTLHEDHEGALWIGTEGGGLTRLLAGVFTTFTTDAGLPRNDVGGISEDRRGNLWLESGGALVQLKEGRFVVYEAGRELPFRIVTPPVEDNQGNLWFGTPGGLVRMAHDGRFTTLTTDDGLPDNRIQAVMAARNGNIWVGTLKGLSVFNDGNITTYTKNDGLPSEYITCLTEDQSSSILIGTWDAGVSKFSSGAFIPFTTKEGLSEDRVRAIATDKENNLWVGTNTGGLNRIRKAEVVSYTRADGLPADSVVPITEDTEGNLWIGASCGGVVRYKDGQFTTFPLTGSSSDCVWSLFADHDGSLWIGTWNGGLSQLRNGKLETYTQTNSGLSSNVVLAIHRDGEGVLWVGTANGLNRFTQQGVTVYRRSDGLAHDDVRFITSGRDGSLLIGTYGGFSRFKDGKFNSVTTATGLSHDFVRAIHEEADGTLWIGTYGGGLNRLKEGNIKKIDTNIGLFDDVISRILEDDRGNLWMSGNKGIFSVRLSELNEVADGLRPAISCISYDDRDGMAVSETNGGGQPAGWRSRDGKLWFPTVKGVALIDPSQAGTNTVPPPVVVERTLFDRRVLDHHQPLDVPAGRGDLEIHYTALSFVEPEDVWFRYRLEGYDDNWIDAGSRRVAYYTNIPPGNYHFRVIAANDDGIWNEVGAGFRFHLAPHFYQTGWFYTLSALALLLVVFAGYRLRVQHLVNLARRLESKVSERTAELERQRNELSEANSRLAEVNAQVERSNDDLLSILNELNAGVLVTDVRGAVTFMSNAAETLVGREQLEVQGIHWADVLPLAKPELERLRKITLLPSGQREKVPALIRSATGQQYWTEIEVQDDPRDHERRIFFLYDVSEVYDLRRLRDQPEEFKGLIGQSAAMQLVFKQILDVARVDATVLIEGETGTGKELVARAIHRASTRRAEPFIPVNCAGLTESLLVSQLFGHKRGAFTGAVADHAGLFEAANGGTLFLDEIGDVPLSVQTSLLRVLQEKEITRLGESIPRKIDVRIICATHRQLVHSVTNGEFREDLLYRIRVARIHLPPLRDRREDIPLLASWFLEQIRASASCRAQNISSEAIQLLNRYDWPGNVRELKSAIEYAAIRCDKAVITQNDLPPEIKGTLLVGEIPTESVNSDEVTRMLAALERAKGNRAAAARMLGISRATFYRRLASLGLDHSAD